MELGRSAHDVDGDGDGDLVIGAPSDDARASDAGAVILHRGSPSGPSASGERIDLGAAVPGGWAGVALDVGDLDGDGLADAIVGATSADPADTTSGFLLVLRGDRARGLVLAGAPIAAPDAAFARHFGESVAIVDDHDGDGFRDVLVGASRTSAPGRAYLFRGDPAAVIARAPIVIEDPDAASGARFGHVVAAARDVDGDGLADLLVGAPFADVGGSREAGRVHLFRAAAPGSPVAIDGPSDAYVYFGYALAGPGDVDGDGLSDVAIGAPFEDRRTDRVDPDEGQVYVLAGSASAPGLVRSPPLATLGRDTGYEYVHAGWSLAAGDVDGDGIVDLIVPEPGIDTSGSTTVDRGLVGFRRARGDGTFDATELLYPDSAVDFMQYGRSVAAIDLDGDGAAEIVGGAHRYRTNEGRAWWHRYPFASTTGTPIAPPTTSGAPRFGWALPASVGRWPVDLDP